MPGSDPPPPAPSDPGAQPPWRKPVLVGSGVVLLTAWGLSAAYVSGRWLASAPYRAEMAQTRAERRAAEAAERERQDALRKLGRDVAANNLATQAEPEGLEAALAAPSTSDVVVVGKRRTSTPPVLAQPRWIAEPEFRVPVSQIPAGGTRISFSCTLTVEGRLTGCSGQGPDQLVRLIQPRLAEARLTPLTVDGRPEATRYSFHYTLAAPPPPALRLPQTSGAPVTANAPSPDSRLQLPGGGPVPVANAKPEPPLTSVQPPASLPGEPTGARDGGQASQPPAD